MWDTANKIWVGSEPDEWFNITKVLYYVDGILLVPSQYVHFFYARSHLSSI